MYNGHRDVGPNAVLAFKREGYKKSDIDLKDLTEVLTYKGFWKIAGNYLGEGMANYVVPIHVSCLPKMHKSLFLLYVKQIFTQARQVYAPKL